MRNFGLIGRKLGHSFSAKFFTAKFTSEQIDANYQLYELTSIDLLPKLLADYHLEGFNVTIPYKESIIPYLDKLTTEAREVGAVNCVVMRDGRLVGHNTDIAGIDASLHWLDIDDQSKALVLGTGGASKAVQYVLRKYGIEYKVVSRDSSRGDITYSELTRDIISSYRLIINTTPLGMYPDIESAPEIDYTAISTEHRIFDLVYNPANTEFLRRAKEQGAQTMGGIMMLQTQAIASWHFWNRVDG